MIKITTTINKLIPQIRPFHSLNSLSFLALSSLAVSLSCQTLVCAFELPLPAVKSGSSPNNSASNQTAVNSTVTETTVKIPNDKDGRKNNTETKKSKPHKTKKTSMEYMSSDDTKPGYNTSVDPVLHYQKAQALANEKKYNAALKEINQAFD